MYTAEGEYDMATTELLTPRMSGCHLMSLQVNGFKELHGHLEGAATDDMRAGMHMHS